MVIHYRLSYRRGSVVAVVELGWPTNILGAKQPLLQAINDGNFAGYKVKTDFVSVIASPSSSPTSSPTPSPGDPTTSRPKGKVN